jgi:S-DNA-T family DNA segregation ATPase FtsK/SpoIIIE
MVMYQLPNPNLLTKSDSIDTFEQQEIARKEADLIEDRSESLGSRLNIEEIVIAPQVVSFKAVPSEGVLARLLPRLAPELQLELGCATIAIHAPSPGSKYVVIEVPRIDRKVVKIGDVIDSASSPLEFPLGIDTSNNAISFDLREAPHMLAGGTTGSGKSTFLHNIICSLLMKTTPDELMFWMFDSKMVELPSYDGIPNLITPVVTDSYEAIEHFKAIVEVMEKRYAAARKYGAKNLEELNEKLLPSDRFPYILVIVDEIADLIFLSKHEIEESITRIAGKARACGIHLVLATQSPRREVISGLLKSNLPSRIAFSTSSELDSRIIIDKNGAGALTGNGDSLFSFNGKAPVRIQSPYISSDEVNSVVDHCKNQNVLEMAA